MSDSFGVDPLPGLNCSALQKTAQVVEQVQLARDTYRIRLECPEIAQQITPGQFFMIRPTTGCDPLLGRPFALYDTYVDGNGEPAGVDFGYVVIGKLTTLMTGWRPGEEVEIWGPLGNGFPLAPAGHLMMIAGGIGQTPFLAVARESLGLRTYGSPARQVAQPLSKVSLCYGVRSSDYLAGLADFEMNGLDVQIATDDGSAGHRGFVTELLLQAVENGDAPDNIFCCGPEPMMHAVAEIAAHHEISCWLSLETPMACGFGACFSCVTKVKLDDGNWDYRRTCVEGPVFRAECLQLS